MVWTSVDATALLTYIVFVFWQPAMKTSTMDKSWYNKQRKRLPCSVPSYVFGIAWGLLFSLISTSGFLYLGPEGLGQSSSLYVSAYIVFVANIIMTKIWTPIFFGKTKAKMGLALFIAILIVLTAGAFATFMLIDGSYIAFGLYSPYILWGCQAIYLNYAFYVTKTSKRVSAKQSGVKSEYDYDSVDTKNGRERPNSTQKRTANKIKIVV